MPGSLPTLARLSLLALLTACSKAPAPPSPAAPAPATTARHADADHLRFAPGSPQLTMIHSSVATAFPLPVAQPLEARLAYDEDVTSRLSLPVSGRVTELRARPGDRVRRGQALLVIDSPDVGSAMADLARAEADLGLKQKTVARLQNLSGGDAVARRELEQAQADLAQARAEQARAALRLRNLHLGESSREGQRLTLRSPLDGVVVERNANPAMEVSPSLTSPLFVVADLRHLWVLADLPEKLGPQVRVGDRLVIESDALPQEHREARVVQVGPTVDPATRRVVLRAKLDNPDGRLMPEMFVRAWLPARRGEPAVRVPNTAIVTRGVHAFVFVETQAGEFQRRRVDLAARGGDDSFVSQGLTAGERVVTQGALLLDAELSAPADGQP